MADLVLYPDLAMTPEEPFFNHEDLFKSNSIIYFYPIVMSIQRSSEINE